MGKRNIIVIGASAGGFEVGGLAALYIKKAIDTADRSELLRTAEHSHEQLSKDRLYDEAEDQSKPDQNLLLSGQIY